MSRTPRERALAQLHASLADGRTLLAAGTGSGLAAAAAEAGGSDLIIAYNSGRFRTAGHGSLSALLPYGDANSIVVDVAREILAVVERAPVVAGVCGTDPFRDLDRFVHELRDLGVAGIQNFPTIGLFGSEFQADLEATGISFEREVELMRAARRAGMLACAYVTDEASARRMALAGIDVLAPLLGVTRQVTADVLSEAATRIDAIASAARTVCDDLLVLFHGGPAVSPDDVRRLLELTERVHGFIAASSVERLPVSAAVETAARSFTRLRGGQSNGSPIGDPPDFRQPPPELPFELTFESLPAYLREKGIVGRTERVEVEELGGGLSNVVLGWRSADRGGVVKQSRPQLRVEEEWLADVRRVLNERDAITLLATRLPAGCVPSLTFNDDDALAFGMEFAPKEALLWKPLLLSGHLDDERARQAGLLLRRLHDCTRDDPVVAARFAARPLLDQNRLEPWYRATARKHSDLADTIEYAIERLLTVTRVLVHGDFVPKNMFLLEDGILVLDYEVVHYGNPGYDVATFVNHMLLKGLREGADRGGFQHLALAFWESYIDGLDAGERELVEQEALLQLGVLMLARVDGKSKVEYLVGSAGADDARAFARWLLRTRPASLQAVLRSYVCELGESR